VLVGTCGINANVIKVRPPLPFSRSDADIFLERFDAGLGRLVG
jgi:4-aminobutyrate aminotransferase-like enzyme